MQKPRRSILNFTLIVPLGKSGILLTINVLDVLVIAGCVALFVGLSLFYSHMQPEVMAAIFLLIHLITALLYSLITYYYVRCVRSWQGRISPKFIKDTADNLLNSAKILPWFLCLGVAAFAVTLYAVFKESTVLVPVFAGLTGIMVGIEGRMANGAVSYMAATRLFLSRRYKEELEKRKAQRAAAAGQATAPESGAGKEREESSETKESAGSKDNEEHKDDKS